MIGDSGAISRKFGGTNLSKVNSQVRSDASGSNASGIFADFIVLSQCFEKLVVEISKKGLPESGAPHICPLTAAETPQRERAASGRQHFRIAGPPV